MTPGHLGRRLMPVLLGSGFLLLLGGLFAPFVEVTSLLWFTDRSSVLGGIWTLVRGDSPGLGLVLLIFSVVLPLTKLALIGGAHFRLTRQRPIHHWIVAALGKWSMLDVFVIATFMGCLQLGVLAEARALWGLNLFAAGVLVSMVAALLVGFESPVESAVSHQGLAAARAALLLAGLSLPLMRIEKWLFWDQDYALLSALPAFWAQGQWMLPVLVGLFVVVVPVLVLVADLAPQWMRPHRLPSWVREWAMLDVFVAALVLVFVKLFGELSVQPLIGFWLLAGVVVLEWLDRLRQP